MSAHGRRRESSLLSKVCFFQVEGRCTELICRSEIRGSGDGAQSLGCWARVASVRLLGSARFRACFSSVQA